MDSKAPLFHLQKPCGLPTHASAELVDGHFLGRRWTLRLVGGLVGLGQVLLQPVGLDENSMTLCLINAQIGPLSNLEGCLQEAGTQELPARPGRRRSSWKCSGHFQNNRTPAAQLLHSMGKHCSSALL